MPKLVYSPDVPDGPYFVPDASPEQVNVVQAADTNLRDIYLNGSDASSKAEKSPLRDIYIPDPITKPASEPILESQSQSKPMLPSWVKDYGDTTYSHARGGIDTFTSGLEDIGQNRTASG